MAKATTAKTAKEQEISLKYFTDATRPSGYKPFDPGKTARTRIATLCRKYAGLDPKGMSLIQTIIESRAAFIAGAGLTPQEANEERRKSNAEAGTESEEMRIIRQTLRWNNLDGEQLYNWCVEAELEGRLLIKIAKAVAVDEKHPAPDGAYDLRHLPYSEYQYRVVLEDHDHSLIKHIEYKTDKGDTATLKRGEFVYKTFGSGRYHDLNGALPRAACCLEDVETCHAARADLRESNHLYAHPTPVFKTATAGEVKSLSTALEARKWHIGDMVVTNAEYSLVGVDTGGTTVLLAEIEAATKRISGNTGVPIFFLGYTEHLTNRATAYAALEGLDINVQGERRRMETALNEIFYEVISARNEEKATGEGENRKPGTLDPQAIAAKIAQPWIIQEQHSEAAAWNLEMFKAGALSLRTLLQSVCQVPDPDKEIRQIKTEQMSLTPKGKDTAKPADDIKPAVEGMIEGIGAAVVDILQRNPEVLKA